MYYVAELGWLYLSMSVVSRPNLPISVILSIDLMACLFIALGGLLPWRARHLYLWDVSGLLLSAALLFYGNHDYLAALPFSIWAGLSMGFGLPIILSKAMAPSTFNDRGKVSAALALGISLLLTSSLALGVVVSGALHVYVLMLIALKLLALTLFVKAAPLDVEPSRDYSTVEGVRRVLAVLFLSWLAFLMIDGVVTHSIVVVYGASFIGLQRAIGIGLGLVFFPVFGYLFDRLGRRPLILLSYLVIGFEYAMLSVYEGALLVYSALEGFTWCALTLYFVFIVWSDIAPPELRAKLYVLGLIPVFLGRLTAHLLKFMNVALARHQLYPFASLFMFAIAVLFYFMPETLPARVIERRKMADYIKKAKRIKERYG